jgi:spore coat protein U-like protein
MMIRRILLATASVGLMTTWSEIVPAATTNATLGITANVAASCTVAAGTVAFGNLTSALATTPVNATGTVTVNCTPGGALSITLSGGNNLTGSQRALANGASRLNYNLTQPTAAGTAISAPPVAWGDGTALGAAYAATGTGAAQVLNVYGTLPAQATALISGAYSDAVTVTLTY